MKRVTFSVSKARVADAATRGIGEGPPIRSEATHVQKPRKTAPGIDRLGISPATLYRYIPATRAANTPGVCQRLLYPKDRTLRRAF
jgi:hypothetical protein